MKWSYETIFSNEKNYKRMNNFYFYSDEMKLIVTYLEQNFFHKHQTVSVKENYWQQFFFPPILAKIQFFFLSKKFNCHNSTFFFSLLFRQWDCHNSTFFSPSILYFGNEIAIIKLLSLSLSLSRQWDCHNSNFFSLSSSSYFDNDIAIIQKNFSLLILVQLGGTKIWQIFQQ